MTKLIDKLILFVLCMACFLQYATGAYIVVPVIAALAATALGSYIERGAITTGVFLLYSAACLVWPWLFFFMPLLCYDILGIRWRAVGFAALVPAVEAFRVLPLAACIFVALAAGVAVVLRLRSDSLENARMESVRLRDSAKEFAMQLENKNKELMDKQDYEVNVATLNERNRIARDIHDSVGHVLSNAMLQTGALLATTQDEATRERLGTLKRTLSDGMDSIRASVHGLYEESVDLHKEVRALTDGFRFCPITLEYAIESNPERKVKYAMLAIAKEALSNVIRHSNATRVTVSLREHPALYQLIVRDNGTKKETGEGGIGLKNIEQRVSALGGVVTVSREGGFTVFASIPREAKP